jgi:hypothetical protein
MTVKANIDYRNGYMSSEFIEGMARRYFGDTVVDALPRYVKGKRKGQLKGFLRWQKVSRGGWVKTGPYDSDGMTASGYVERRVGMVINVDLSIRTWGSPETLIATWDWEQHLPRDSVKVIVHETKAA